MMDSTLAGLSSNTSSFGSLPENPLSKVASPSARTSQLVSNNFFQQQYQYQQESSSSTFTFAQGLGEQFFNNAGSYITASEQSFSTSTSFSFTQGNSMLFAGGGRPIFYNPWGIGSIFGPIVDLLKGMGTGNLFDVGGIFKALQPETKLIGTLLSTQEVMTSSLTRMQSLIELNSYLSRSNLQAFVTDGSTTSDYLQLTSDTSRRTDEGYGYVRCLDGDDQVKGSETGDIVNGNKGSDILYGSQGADFLMGGQDGDNLDGGGDSDRLNGNKGSDNIIGGIGDDFCQGGRDNDIVNGGEGNDIVSGDRGIDILTGGTGSDQFMCTFYDSQTDIESVTTDVRQADILTDFNAAQGDKICLSGLTSITEISAIDVSVNYNSQTTQGVALVGSDNQVLCTVLNQSVESFNLQSSVFTASSTDVMLV